METWAELESVFVFLQGRPILTNITVGLPRGQITGILGPNGSGKSTLLKVLSGEILYRGSAVINGVDLRSLSKSEISALVAVVPQHHAAGEDFTAAEVVLMGCYARNPRLWESAADRDLMERSMQRVGVESLANRSMQKMSGGEAQRVLIARALCQQATIQLWDEPMAHLDVRYQQDLGRLSRQLAKDGASLFVACHDVLWVQAYCDTVIILDGGHIVDHLPAQELEKSSNLSSTFGINYAVNPNSTKIRIVPDFE